MNHTRVWREEGGISCPVQAIGANLECIRMTILVVSLNKMAFMGVRTEVIPPVLGKAPPSLSNPVYNLVFLLETTLQGQVMMLSGRDYSSFSGCIASTPFIMELDCH